MVEGSDFIVAGETGSRTEEISHSRYNIPGKEYSKRKDGNVRHSQSYESRRSFYLGLKFIEFIPLNNRVFSLNRHSARIPAN